MLFCVNCSLNLAGIELEKEGFCPLCDSPVRTIKTLKLVNVLTELNQAVVDLNSDKIRKSPKNIIAISSVIEAGERKLKRELNRRIMNLKDIEYELKVISKFADFLGYDMTPYKIQIVRDTPPETEPEEPEEPEEDENTNGDNE